VRRANNAPRGVAATLYGETPYGWRLSRDRSKLVVDADEQRVVAVVRHMYFVERLAMREIVERLRSMGVVNRRGNAFGLTSVHYIIHSQGRVPREARPSRPRQ
jgi:hypothetical protein